MDQLPIADLFSVETNNIDNTALLSLLPTEQMESVELDTPYELLQRQIEELTKQLNESKLAEKHANDEREKYLQMYNRTTERFLAFEHKQLEQIRRILSILTLEEQQALLDDSPGRQRAFSSPPAPILLLSASNPPFYKTVAHQKAETDWDEVLAQISEIMDFSEKFARKYFEQTDENTKLISDFTSLQTEYEKEQQMRHQFENQFNEANKLIEMDHSKRLQKLRNYATLADDEGDILLSSLMRKAEKNDIDFGEMKFQYENAFAEQVNHIKKLVKERELLHLYIQRLERENTSLASRTNEDETVQLLTYSSQKPTTYEEACNLVHQLREEIIQQIKIQDKLRNDAQQLQHNHNTDIREREQIDELLNRDLGAANDQILVLESVRSEYERILKLKNTLERDLEECNNELVSMRSVTNSLITQLKGQTEGISLEKERLDEENIILRNQLQTLKIDFENSESVQHDFVKLSQALQVQLEEFRNSANELRWQPEEDFSECQKCKTSFSVTWRKYHCRHCGKVLCKECVNKTVYSGPNNRPSRVCDVCYMLLNRNSQPYFLAGVPKVR